MVTSKFDALEEFHGVGLKGLAGSISESQSKDVIEQEEFANDYGYSSDSDLEDDEDEKPWLKQINKPEINSFDPFPAPSEDQVGFERNKEQVEKVVKIPDVAFVT